MASASGKVQDQLKQCQKLLQFITQHKDAEPFQQPVDWKGWGLVDYPKVIKTPMDLGTVKKKLERGEYLSAKELRHDVNLIWTNCMMYNADGSPYYNLAYGLHKTFEEKFLKIVKEDEEGGQDLHRPPTLVDKKMFSQNIYNITAEDLGRVVQILDQKCEASIKKIDPEDIEIDIDAIDPATFWLLDGFVKDMLPGGKKHMAKKAAGKSAGAGASSSAGPEPKKQKLG